MKKIGIIGCGAIGSELARAIVSRKINASLVAIFDKYRKASEKLAARLQRKLAVASTIDEFLQNDMEIVVEASSQEAVRNYAKRIIDRRCSLMIMSVGALLDNNLYKQLATAAERKGVKLYFPTGAIAGIDAIRSVRNMLSEVTLTTTKSPRSLEGAPFFNSHKINLRRLKKPTVIYKGKAVDAVKLFPANVNVAAVLSLAGLGGNRTIVRIVADPKIRVNMHEINAKGKFGEMAFRVQNVPSPANIKTSYLAVLSAIECLRSITDDNVKIGT